MKMYECRNRCKCARCARVRRNCAECKYSIDRTDECLADGIKECKYFKEEMKQL